MTVEFVAEVSSNHQRSLERLLAFVDAAADAGFDTVKLQLFRIRELFSAGALSQNPKLLAREAWELPVEFLPPVAERCAARELALTCTPFYLDAVRELEPFVSAYKVASYELLWDDLLRACAKTGKPVVLSTGMATLPEILRAVEVLRESGCAAPTLLHAVSAYPTPADACNLAAIETIRAATGCLTGWSDHTVDPGVIHRAVHRWGACQIEVHLDLDGEGAEYAAGHCWLPGQIGQVIADVRRALTADGHGVKAPTPPELADRDWRADPTDGLRPLRSVRETWKNS